MGRTWARRLRAGIPGYLLVAPAVLVTLVFLVIPMIQSGYWSLTVYNGIKPPQFVGLQNYVNLLTDPRFLQIIANTVFFVVMGMAIGPLLGLGSAILLNQSVRLRALFRTTFFLPTMVSLVAVATVWKMLYQDQGMVNQVLAMFGLQGADWLNDPTTALPAVVVTSIWQGFGFETVVFLAALQSIPREYYDAARVDGAGAWPQFRHVTLPGLRHTIVFVYVIGIIGSFQVFDQVFVMTQGRPGIATRTMVYELVEQFQNLHLGTASAIAYILLAILAVLSYIQIRLGEGD
jgi:ABC-type sugar transport system permease subunit